MNEFGSVGVTEFCLGILLNPAVLFSVIILVASRSSSEFTFAVGRFASLRNLWKKNVHVSQKTKVVGREQAFNFD